MNERINQLAEQAKKYALDAIIKIDFNHMIKITDKEQALKVYSETYDTKFAELIVAECVNREALLGAIARGWCSEKNSHKTMDSDLAVAIFDEVEQQIRQQFGIK
jgi:hypothetical protein